MNKTLWGIIGAASYYIPILLMSFVILPMLITNGTITITDETSITFLAIGLNLAVGIICCSIAYQILKNMKPNVDESVVDILDHNMD